MNSTIRGLRLASFALCGTVLVACDSVKDVREGPTYAIPSEKVALTGRITGVGVSTTRPVELTMTVTNDRPYNRDDDPDGDGARTVVRSVRGTNALDFGALDVGATYSIAVTGQPFGRSCTPVNPAPGAVVTVVAELDARGNLLPIEDIEIQCERDSASPYYVTANFPALAGNLPEGFTLTLSTEEGQQAITAAQMAPGATSVTFDDLPVFYPAANPPAFAYRVTATNTENGTLNSCSVTNGTGELGAGSGNVTDVTVTGCLFEITATASYSAPPGGAPAAIAAGGQLSLKDRSGNLVSTVPLVSGSATLAVNLPSNASALYEVLVSEQPAGQFCTVDNGGLASLVPLAYIDDPSTPGRDPKITPANPANVVAQVRCRNLPSVANQLTGTYQVMLKVLPVSEENPRPLANAPNRHFLTFFANGTFLYGVHHATPPSPANSPPATGVEHGFYSYDSLAQTLAFNIFTDTNGSVGSSAGVSVAAVAGCGYSFSLTFAGSVGPPCAPGTVTGPSTVFPACGGTCTITAPAYMDVTASAPSNPTGGLSGIGGTFPVRLAFNPAAFPPNFAAATVPLTASVIRTAATPGVAPLGGAQPSPANPGLPAIGPQLSLTFGATTWTLVQPISPTWEWYDNEYPGVDDEPFWAPGQMEGAWVTPDSRRVWVYDQSSLYGWHAGVNGAPNLQEACFPSAFRPTTFGYDRFYARRGCNILGDIVNNAVVGITTIDVPNILSVPALVPGFVGRMPGSASSATAQPSPVYFRIEPGVGDAPETLTLQNTANDVPVGPPLVFVRSIAN